MGIRETMNKRPAMTTGVTIGIIVLALLLIIWQIWGGDSGFGGSGKMFFTTDDTSQQAAVAALFADDAEKIPPFDHNGKPAYRAYVYTANAGKTTFIHYIERYTPEGVTKMKEVRDAMKKVQAGGVNVAVPDTEAIEMKHKEIMKPGVTKWGKASDPRHQAIVLRFDLPPGVKNEEVEPAIAK